MPFTGFRGLRPFESECVALAWYTQQAWGAGRRIAPFQVWQAGEVRQGTY